MFQRFQRYQNMNDSRYHENIYHVIQSYNTNIHMYNRNMENLIRLMQNNDARDNIRINTQTQTSNLNRFSNIFDMMMSDPLFTYGGSSSNMDAPRGLSREQINQSTQRIHYDLSFNETRCPISLDDFEQGEEIMRINGCGHIFKTANLNQWLQRCPYCPVCRYQLNQPINTLNTNQNTTTNQHQNIRPNQNQTTRINYDDINSLASLMTLLFPSNSTTSPYEINASYTFEIPVNRSTQNRNDEDDTDSVD